MTVRQCTVSWFLKDIKKLSEKKSEDAIVWFFYFFSILQCLNSFSITSNITCSISGSQNKIHMSYVNVFTRINIFHKESYKVINSSSCWSSGNTLWHLYFSQYLSLFFVRSCTLSKPLLMKLICAKLPNGRIQRLSKTHLGDKGW